MRIINIAGPPRYGMLIAGQDSLRIAVEAFVESHSDALHQWIVAGITGDFPVADGEAQKMTMEQNRWINLTAAKRRAEVRSHKTR